MAFVYNTAILLQYIAFSLTTYSVRLTVYDFLYKTYHTHLIVPIVFSVKQYNLTGLARVTVAVYAISVHTVNLWSFSFCLS